MAISPVTCLVVFASSVSISTTTPLRMNNDATSTALVRYPPGLSRRSSTKEWAPREERSSNAERTSVSEFCVSCLREI